MPAVIAFYDMPSSWFNATLNKQEDWTVVTLSPSEEDPEPVIANPDLIICTDVGYLRILRKLYPPHIPIVYIGFCAISAPELPRQYTPHILAHTPPAQRIVDYVRNVLSR